jgi:hypothetical protein
VRVALDVARGRARPCSTAWNGERAFSALLSDPTRWRQSGAGEAQVRSGGTGRQPVIHEAGGRHRCGY